MLSAVLAGGREEFPRNVGVMSNAGKTMAATMVW
jgi:hypothetical protein